MAGMKADRFSSRLRQRIFEDLDVGGGYPRSSTGVIAECSIIALVALNVLAVILETEHRLYLRHRYLFHSFDTVSVALFSVEYVLRLWACTHDGRFRHPLTGRLKFAVTPLAVVDLVAVLPFYLPMLIQCDLRFLRVIRLMRLFRLFKTTRYVTAANIIGSVLKSKREELLISLYAMLILLILASSLMYEVEHRAQPEVFTSIPAAMWWGIVTLTSVGYGDMYPVTVVGKICAALIAVLSMGLFALPAGIFASGFAEAIRRKPDRGRDVCPHCGGVIGPAQPAPSEQEHNALRDDAVPDVRA
jgi:voltage-gated potassium channel